MSVSQANGNGPHSGRRRRGGGARRRYHGDDAAATANGQTPTPSAGRGGENNNNNNNNVGGGAASGGGRGGGGRTIWEGKPSTAAAIKAASGRSAAQTSAPAPVPAAGTPPKGGENYDHADELQRDGNGHPLGDDGDNAVSIPSKVKASSAGRGGGNRGGVGGGGGGGGGRGQGKGGGRSARGTAGVNGGGPRSVHPGMLESEFLAATGQADAGFEGGPAASLSLEEVPYDRDLRWCNTASDSRPRPSMNISGGVFGRVGAAITHETGEYERLDHHYQELWKDREGNGPPNAIGGRGRGGGGSRPVRGGRGRGRGPATVNRAITNGPRGGPATSTAATAATAPATPGRGPGTASPDNASKSRRDNSGASGGGGGGGGGRGSRGPTSKRGESPVNKGGHGGVPAAIEAAGAGGGGGASAGSNRRRAQRAGGSGRVMTHMGRGGGGNVGGGTGNAMSNSSPPHFRNTQQPAMVPPFRVQGGNAIAAAGTGSSRQGCGGSANGIDGSGGNAPLTALRNGRRGWDVRDQQQRQSQGHLLVAHGHAPWPSEAGLPLRGSAPLTHRRQSPPPPPPSLRSSGPDGLNGTAIVASALPTGVPAMMPPSPFVAFPPPESSSPEYMGDLANVLSSARSMLPPSSQLPSPLAATYSPPQGLSSIGVSHRQPLQVTAQPGSTVHGGNHTFDVGIGMMSDFEGDQLGAFPAKRIGLVGNPGSSSRSSSTYGSVGVEPHFGSPLPPSVMAPSTVTAQADIMLLADPSLDVDIQDICADPDLNADAPAFVPGGYLPP